MSKSGIFKKFITVLSCVSMCIPSMAIAGGSHAQAKTQVRDVKLDQGKLNGQVVDAQGIAISNVEVIVARDGKILGSTTSNGAGIFEVSGIRAGLLQIVTAEGQVVCRAWSERTAPPSARDGILLVNGSAIRGQNTSQAAGYVQSDNGAVRRTNHVHHPGNYNPALVHRGGIGVFADSHAIVPNGQPGIGANLFGGGLRSALSNPVVVAGVLGAAIATPIAVLDDDDAS